MSKEHPATRKWVSAKFLSQYFSVSEVTIWTWAREGKLPPPKKFSANATRWDLDEIEKAIEAA
jgi:predicted DNA-binding transcriptional regulator AlpA